MTAPVLIELVFVALGLGFGDSGYALLKTIPDAVLGGSLRPRHCRRRAHARLRGCSERVVVKMWNRRMELVLFAHIGRYFLHTSEIFKTRIK